MTTHRLLSFPRTGVLFLAVIALGYLLLAALPRPAAALIVPAHLLPDVIGAESPTGEDRCLNANEPAKTSGSAVISIRTSAGKPVPFTILGTPHLEIVNDRLNLALRSNEGMIFELTGIPAKGAVASRRYKGAEYRALLLHPGFQKEAATDDPFEKTSLLEIRTRTTDADGDSAEFIFSGKLHAGPETLDVTFKFSGLLPSNRQFIAPASPSPSSSSK